MLIENGLVVYLYYVVCLKGINDGEFIYTETDR